jgi:hypothetical protein
MSLREVYIQGGVTVNRCILLHQTSRDISAMSNAISTNNFHLKSNIAHGGAFNPNCSWRRFQSQLTQERSPYGGDFNFIHLWRHIVRSGRDHDLTLSHLCHSHHHHHHHRRHTVRSGRDHDLTHWCHSVRSGRDPDLTHRCHSQNVSIELSFCRSTPG